VSVWPIIAVAGALSVAAGASGIEIPEDAAAESFFRAVGFSPYGVVMLLIANDVRKKLPPIFTSIATEFREIKVVLREYVEATRLMAAAVKERTAAELAGQIGPHASAPRTRDRRPKTDPHMLPR
jgi:hypothetical protein